MSCEHEPFQGDDEISRIRGNNFDIVTYRYVSICVLCGAEGAEHGRPYTVREKKEGYVEVELRDGRAPSRYGT